MLTDPDDHGLRLDAVYVRSDRGLFDVRQGSGIRGRVGDIVVGVAQVMAVVATDPLAPANQTPIRS